MRGKMEFKRILQYLLLTLMLIYLVTGCGDLEPEMQDTRTVILKMDFNQRSSLRTSSVSPAELSNYKTHLVMAQPSSEHFSSSYLYPKSLAEGLMDPVSRKITLKLKLNTQMKIFAFLFREKYIHYDLFSAKRDVGYYGQSQPFSIGSQTDSLRLNIRLTQVSGTDTGGGTDNTTMDPSLEAFYPFNGNANDESGNSYHGQLGDNVDTSKFPTLTTDRYGNADKAFLFDGDDYIALDKYVTPNSISEITVCAWVLPTDTTNKKFIISFDRSESYRLALKDGGNTYVGWDTTDSNGSTTTHDLRTSGSYSYENGQSYTIEDGNWHHICGWFNKSSTVDKKIFVDGVMVISNSNTHSGRNLGTFDRSENYGFIGWGSEASSFNGNGSGVHQNDFMRGKIDDVRIYSRSLSDEEISALYLSEKP